MQTAVTPDFPVSYDTIALDAAHLTQMVVPLATANLSNPCPLWLANR